MCRQQIIHYVRRFCQRQSFSVKLFSRKGGLSLRTSFHFQTIQSCEVKKFCNGARSPLLSEHHNYGTIDHRPR